MAEVLFIVGSGPRNPERLAELTDELADDLRQIDGVRARVATADADPGTKTGVAQEIGQLIVSGGALSVASLAIRDVALRFLERTRAVSITVRKGKREVVIERPADRQVDQIVEQLRDLLGDD
ncbi:MULTISPECIES: hypothetical protein [unclassified Nocardia]|uniref:effector-associated constant component EACC1 n=1 Tax=unclassified Nocardia TaxID=2637762 RepID=UPI001CE48F92|nr:MULTISPECIES: hypothetical protein [unclassified Nocardia]